MAPRNEENWQVHYPEIKMRSAHLLRTRDWTDCSFQFQTGGTATEGGSKDSLTAHKLILAMASPVFAVMFYGDVGDKESPVIITDIELPTFSLLLEYIYTDEVSLSDTQLAVNLIGAANKYILVHLEKICLDFLFEKLDSNNVCQIYEFSCLYDEEELKKKCLELISAKTIDVLESPSFRNIHVETLKHIVSMEYLVMDSEMDLFNAVVVYMDNMKCTDDQNLTVQSSECTDVKLPPENANQNTDESKELISKKRRVARKHLPGVVEQIRFLTLTPADLVENGEIATVLTKDEMLALFANSVSTKATIPMPEGFSISRDIRKPEPKNKRGRPEAPVAKGRKGPVAKNAKATPVKRKPPTPPAKKKPGKPAAKPAKKGKKVSSDEESGSGSEEEEDEEKTGSEEEESGEESDAPADKKAKRPPTDDEIKEYVKQILEGANLEQITMKTVCKQVYSHYPDFDLAHKKDFIKATVKSCI